MRSVFLLLKKYVLFGLSLITAQVFAAPLSDQPAPGAVSIDAQEQQRQQARERALREQHTPDSDVRLTSPRPALPDYPVNERPCFTLHTLLLTSDSVSIPHNRAILIQRSSGILTLSAKETAMHKAHFTEHQIIMVINPVETGRTVKDVCREAGIAKSALN